VVNKAGRSVVRTSFANGKRRGFRLFKESGVHVKPETILETGTGFTRIAKVHKNSAPPKKRSKKHPPADENKLRTRGFSGHRAVNEHVTGFVKRFKIVADRYRNRRKRFGLRFNLICGICNFELNLQV
jgi:hypothetical protein